MQEGDESEVRSDEPSQEEPEEGEDRAEFVPKEFVARKWESETMEASTAEVEEMSVRSSRPLIKMRLTKKRREFNNENRNLMDKDGGDSIVEIKPKSSKMPKKTTRVLELGLQANRPMKTFNSQTYHNRQINKSAQYKPVKADPNENVSAEE